MKIVISPSKTQNDNYQKEFNNNFLIDSLPEYEKNAFFINDILKNELNKNNSIWKELEIKDNQKLKEKTLDNCLNFNQNKMMAIFKYEGLQFKNIDFKNIEKKYQNNLNKNLIILSAYYGILKPSDVIGSYRLMMNSKIYVDNVLLKDYWKDIITKKLFSYNEPILNLSSNEYSYVLDKTKLNVIDIEFLKFKNNKYTNSATNAKMCRGKMVNLLSQFETISIDDLKTLQINNHYFCKELSNNNHLIYVQKT